MSANYQSRIKVGNTTLPFHQAKYHPSGLRHEVSLIPQTSQANFGSYYILDYKEGLNKLDNISLVFKVSALTHDLGEDDNGKAIRPAFVPSYFWVNRIEIVQSNAIIDTIYSSEQFILNQLIYRDAERLTHNNLSGNYASREQRANKAATTSEYHIHLHTFIDQTKLNVLANSDNIQLRVYLNPLDQITDNAGVKPLGIPTATILSSSLVVKHTKLNHSGLHLVEAKERMKTPHSAIFHDLRYGLFNITMSNPTGIQTFNIVLTSIVGKVAFLLFTIRNSSAVSNENAYHYLDVDSYDILDSAGSSLVGGTPISYTQNQKLLHSWSKSSYTEETMYNANLVGDVRDNGANINLWSFSEHPIEAITYGRALSSHTFQGNEQLRLYINASSPYYANLKGGSRYDSPVYQVDVFAFTESVHVASGFEVKKVSL